MAAMCAAVADTLCPFVRACGDAGADALPKALFACQYALADAPEHRAAALRAALQLVPLTRVTVDTLFRRVAQQVHPDKLPSDAPRELCGARAQRSACSPRRSVRRRSHGAPSARGQ
jgi:hypothetical protein